MHTYMGINIHRNTEPHKLRWWALTPVGLIAADTLAGMKAYIREIQLGGKR